MHIVRIVTLIKSIRLLRCCLKRKIFLGVVGLDVAAAQAAFADFIQAGNLRGDQITFINSIITYLTKNGMIDKKMLFEPPFTNIHDQGLFGVFDDADVSKVIQLIDRVNENAVVVEVKLGAA